MEGVVDMAKAEGVFSQLLLVHRGTPFPVVLVVISFMRTLYSYVSL